MKLRDGTYAFGLLATMNDVQQCTAVSVPIHKSSAPTPTLAIMPAPEPEPEPEIEMEPPPAEEEEEEEEDSEGGDESDEGEEEGEDDEDEDENDDDEEEEDEEEDEEMAMDGPAASSAGAGPSASSDAGRHSSLMPLKKRAAASAAAAREAALAIVHDDDDDDRHGRHGRGAVTSGASQVLHRRWEPRTSDAALSWVAIFVLARLRRRNAPLSSESMLPVALTALSQQPNAPRGLGLTDAGPALVDTLRVLVRIGFVARRRATPLGDGGRGRAAGLPMYALSSYGQEQLFTAVQARGTNKAAPHGVGSGAIGGPAIGAPAIGSAGGGAHPGRPNPRGAGGRTQGGLPPREATRQPPRSRRGMPQPPRSRAPRLRPEPRTQAPHRLASRWDARIRRRRSGVRRRLAVAVRRRRRQPTALGAVLVARRPRRWSA